MLMRPSHALHRQGQFSDATNVREKHTARRPSIQPWSVIGSEEKREAANETQNHKIEGLTQLYWSDRKRDTAVLEISLDSASYIKGWKYG